MQKQNRKGKKGPQPTTVGAVGATDRSILTSNADTWGSSHIPGGRFDATKASTRVLELMSG